MYILFTNGVKATTGCGLLLVTRVYLYEPGNSSVSVKWTQLEMLYVYGEADCFSRLLN